MEAWILVPLLVRVRFILVGGYAGREGAISTRSEGESVRRKRAAKVERGSVTHLNAIFVAEV